MGPSGVSTTWQAGYVAESTVVHGVRPTINGYRAWCGAGPIETVDVQPFDLGAADACEVCARLLRTPVPLPRTPSG